MRDQTNPIGGFIGVVALGLGVIGLLTVMFGSWYTIDQTQRGVLLRNGAIVEIVQPGLHFKTPWIESVIKTDMQTHTLTLGGKTGKMEAYSADQQPANIVVSVTYQLATDKVAEFYSRFGGDYDAARSRLIVPLVNKETKIVFGQYTAAKAITQRGALNTDTSTALALGFANDPIFHIDSVQIENIEFSPEYIKSVEQRMQAEVEVQRQQQNLAQEKIKAQIAVTQAQAKADSVVAQAKADAESTILRGDSEAKAIRARGDALAANPKLVDLVQAERWDGKLPTTMLPGGALPMIGVGR